MEATTTWLPAFSQSVMASATASGSTSSRTAQNRWSTFQPVLGTSGEGGAADGGPLR